ncbi:hypothetical protein, partial [Ensifer oleiphilus]|uniref:hypothetical protein n=1 Tax=Ensifer oleiphilus TaxID=2742698 RepID=UPI001AED5912
LVSDRAYRPHTSNTSTDNFKKLTRNNNALKTNRKYETEFSTASKTLKSTADFGDQTTEQPGSMPKKPHERARTSYCG